MKILRTKTFSLKDKFKEFNQKLDDKLMKAIVKDEKTLDDTIHQYKEMLKDESLSEKDKKQLKGLLVTAKRVKKTFSEKEKSESKRAELKLIDRINSAQYKLYKKGGKLEENERERLNNTKKFKKNSIIGSALGGAALGAIEEMGYGPFADPVKGAAKGAALLGGAAALGHVGRDILEKKSPKYKKGWDKQKDLLDYRMGKLSKEEYIKRWGGTINGKKVEGSKNKEDK